MKKIYYFFTVCPKLQFCSKTIAVADQAQLIYLDVGINAAHNSASATGLFYKSVMKMDKSSTTSLPVSSKLHLKYRKP